MREVGGGSSLMNNRCLCNLARSQSGIESASIPIIDLLFCLSFSLVLSRMEGGMYSVSSIILFMTLCYLLVPNFKVSYSALIVLISSSG